MTWISVPFFVVFSSEKSSELPVRPSPLVSIAHLERGDSQTHCEGMALQVIPELVLAPAQPLSGKQNKTKEKSS